MSSLLALILVARTPLGASIVFSYPANPVAVPRTLQPVYRSFRPGKNAAQEPEDLDPASEDDGAEIQLDTAEHRGLDRYLGYSNAVLASILCPARELCDQPFELVLDHLAFVGHPVLVLKDDSLETRGRPTTRIPEYLSGSESSELSSTHTSNTSNFAYTEGRINSFNFLAVIDTPADCHLSSHLETYYNDVVLPFTAHLKYLERKHNWLGSEAGKLRRMTESFSHAGTELSSYDFMETLPTKSELAAAMSNLYDSLKNNTVANVKLDRFNFKILLGPEIPIDATPDNLQLFDNLDPNVPSPGNSKIPPFKNRSVSDGIETEESLAQHAPLFSKGRKRPDVVFQRWQSIVLLDEPENLKKDSTGSVMDRFLDECDPTMSIKLHAKVLNFDDDERSIHHIINHLVKWKKARIVHRVDPRLPYTMSAKAHPSRIKELITPFHLKFPTLPHLPVLLSRLKAKQPFESMVPSKDIQIQELWIQALIWLVRHDIVDQQRTFLRVLVSPEIKKRALSRGTDSEAGSVLTPHLGVSHSDQSLTPGSVESRSPSNPHGLSAYADWVDSHEMAIVGAPGVSAPVAKSHTSLRIKRLISAKSRTTVSTTYSSVSEQADDNDKNMSIILEPGRPSTAESRWLNEICRDKDPGAVEVFNKVVRMLNGSHDTSEMCHRAMIGRKYLSHCMQEFEEHLIVFTHP